MIIGTAGHIDHGKTSLVKALTGVDADRLKEEKARGITIDLGFAYQALPDGSLLGFVDVPGHEKLVRNMLAGATGIDHVMLVIAADDGPMPQTREHLAIVELLGLRSGVVVLSKADRAGPARRAAVQAEVSALLAPTGLRQAPILAVSSVTGEGLQALREHLAQAQSAVRQRPQQEPFRLAVDRSFTLAGIGTVLTGTASSGRVAVGDRLLLSPSGLELRVRGIHAQSQAASEGQAGQRLALQVSGIEKAQARRGDWLLHPHLHAPTQRLDVRLRALPGHTQALRHGSPVHLHLGAEDVMARVLHLQAQPSASAPAEAAWHWVQLDLDRPIGALQGDRFILRDAQAQHTVGGGHVVDAFAPSSRRRRAQRVQVLQALDQAEPAESLRALLRLQPTTGVWLQPWLRQRRLSAAQGDALLADIPHERVDDAEHTLLFAEGQLAAYARALQDHLATYHRKQPDHPGLTQDQLTRQLRDRPGGSVWPLLLNRLVKQGLLRRNGPHLSLASHVLTLQGAEKDTWERLKPWLDEGGIHPPKLSDMLERDRRLRKDQVMRTLQRLQRMGQVHAVGAEYFIQTRHVLQLALGAQALAASDPQRRLNVRDLRERMGISRHLSVPLVEFFDAIGLTARDEIGRHFKRDPRKMFEGS